MLNQTNVRDKFQVIKGGVRNLLDRFQHMTDSKASSQGDGVVDADTDLSSRGNMHEFTPDENLRTNDQDVSYDKDLSAVAYEDYDSDEDEDEDLDDSDFVEDSGSGQANRYS